MLSIQALRDSIDRQKKLGLLDVSKVVELELLFAIAVSISEAVHLLARIDDGINDLDRDRI